MQPQKIEITYKTIVFTVAFLLCLALIWSIREILILLFICFIIMLALNPTVTKLEKYKIPRVLAILLIYIFVIAFFGIALAGIIPILINQTSELLKILPSSLENLQLWGFTAVDFSSQFKILETIPADIAQTVISIFSNIFSGFVILVVTFYLLIERKNLKQYSAKFIGLKNQKIVSDTFDHLELRLGSWVKGELLLMTVIGVLSYIGFLFLGLPYALPLALIAAILEIVPNIGPIISTTLAILVGLTVSPLTAMFAGIWGIAIQQIENNFIVPKIMKQAVGLNPIITILTIATGAKLGGVGGALLAVPVYLTLETIFHVLIENRRLTRN